MPSDSEPAPIHITAAAAHAGERIDRFLADALGTLSRSRVKALIEEGRLRVEAGPVTQPAEPVRAGVTYTLDVPAPIAANPRPQAIPFPILYEDADLIVLDKPAGLVVHPAPGNLDGTLGERAARALRARVHRHRRRTAAGDRASAGQGHIGRHGRGQDTVGQRRPDRPLSPPATSTEPTSPLCGACRSR